MTQANQERIVSSTAVGAQAGNRFAFPIGSAFRRALGKGYGAAELRADVLAGMVVGIVALPLSMALAIAVGAPPQHGLYTAIVAGSVVALLGGCKFQVTGPTAAFVVVLAPIVSKYGVRGLLTAGLLAGGILVVMGVAKMGNLIRFIPYPVTTGFTSGIAVVIATLQLKDIFGLQLATMPEHYVEKIAALWEGRSTARLPELGVAAATLALLILVPRWIRRIPAPLIALGVVAAAAALAHRLVPSFDVATIGSRFRSTVGGVEVAGIPPMLPSPALPWGAEGLSFHLIRALLPAATAIALLGAIESLLSAVIADGMTDTKHDPNAELVGLGIGNLLAPFFGGIAATGALARTATNIRAGARSPIAAVVHAVVVLLAMLFLAPLVAYVPMAALAALLLLVAWNMSEVHHFAEILKQAPKSDVAVLLTCFGLTVFFDMVIAVSVGFVLSSVLFMRRMSELTEATIQLDASREGSLIDLPPKTLVYEINGPLFFGAAQKAMGALATASRDVSVLIIHLGRVPAIDATGMVALQSAIANARRLGQRVIVAGPFPRPERVFANAQLELKHPGLRIAPDLAAAVVIASEVTALDTNLREEPA